MSGDKKSLRQMCWRQNTTAPKKYATDFFYGMFFGTQIVNKWHLLSKQMGEQIFIA
jgi:hypothetical protein